MDGFPYYSDKNLWPPSFENKKAPMRFMQIAGRLCPILVSTATFGAEYYIT
jgi:hypothetical protein